MHKVQALIPSLPVTPICQIRAPGRWKQVYVHQTIPCQIPNSYCQSNPVIKYRQSGASGFQQVEWEKPDSKWLVLNTIYEDIPSNNLPSNNLPEVSIWLQNEEQRQWVDSRTLAGRFNPWTEGFREIIMWGTVVLEWGVQNDSWSLPVRLFELFNRNNWQRNVAKMMKQGWYAERDDYERVWRIY